MIEFLQQFDRVGDRSPLYAGVCDRLIDNQALHRGFAVAVGHDGQQILGVDRVAAIEPEE